jgi:hypothetical protein
MTFLSLMHRSSSSPGLTIAGLNTELMILFAVLAVLSVVLLIAAAYLRRGPLRHQHRRHHHHHSGKPSEQGTGTVNPAPPKKWRRRRRRDHRPRNPTLAETGGLPPVRSDNAPERPV